MAIIGLPSTNEREFRVTGNGGGEIQALHDRCRSSFEFLSLTSDPAWRDTLCAETGQSARLNHRLQPKICQRIGRSRHIGCPST